MPSNSKTIDPGKKAVKQHDGSADTYQRFLSDMLRECRALGRIHVEVFQNEVVMATEDNVVGGHPPSLAVPVVAGTVTPREFAVDVTL